MFGEEKSNIIFSFYDKQINVNNMLFICIQINQTNDNLLEQLNKLIRDTFTENYVDVNFFYLKKIQFSQIFSNLIYYEINLENVQKEITKLE